MSYDEARVRELQSALRVKMAENKSIADSFKVEEGTVVVSSEQKSAFDSNMRDIREIRSLIDGLEQMKDVDGWSREEGNSVAVEYNAKSAENALYEAARDMGFKSIGQMFTESPEFKSLLATCAIGYLFQMSSISFLVSAFAISSSSSILPYRELRILSVKGSNWLPQAFIKW